MGLLSSLGLAPDCPEGYRYSLFRLACLPVDTGSEGDRLATTEGRLELAAALVPGATSIRGGTVGLTSLADDALRVTKSAWDDILSVISTRPVASTVTVAAAGTAGYVWADPDVDLSDVTDPIYDAVDDASKAAGDALENLVGGLLGAFMPLFILLAVVLVAIAFSGAVSVRS